MASITFDRVGKRYGEVTAVEDLSLEVGDGEFAVLLGPSGCGKTTALRMIAGFEDITEGSVRIGDQVVNGLAPAQRNVSMVFQSYALYPHMTVAKNIESPLLVRKYAVDGPSNPPRKLSKAERGQRVVEAARILQLDPYLQRKPKALSGGQRQRVALGRAIVAHPMAYLMDEPLSNLDAKLRGETRRELVDLHRRVEGTFVYVTHDQVEAMTMATRIAIMSMGRLQQVGTPEEVYNRPANQFVAQFIGMPPMNCLGGRFTSERGPAAVVGTSRFPVPTSVGTRLEEGRPLVVGFRSEDLRPDGGGDIAATITALEWLGNERLVFATIEDHSVVARQPGADPAPTPGPITLSINPARVHLFDPVSTQRLT